MPGNESRLLRGLHSAAHTACTTARARSTLTSSCPARLCMVQKAGLAASIARVKASQQSIAANKNEYRSSAGNRSSALIPDHTRGRLQTESSWGCSEARCLLSLRAIAANLLLGDSCSLVAAATKIVGCHSTFSALRKDETGTSQVLAKSPNAASICFTIQGEPQSQDAHKLEKHTIPKPWSQMCQLGEAGDHIRQAHAMLEAAVGPPERTTQRVREGLMNF